MLDGDFIFDYEIKLAKGEICLEIKIYPGRFITLIISDYSNDNIGLEMYTLNLPVNLNWILLRKIIETHIIFPKQLWMIDGHQLNNDNEIKVPEKEIRIEKIYTIQIEINGKIENIYSPLNISICDLKCSIDLKSSLYAVFHKKECLEKSQSLLSYIKNFDMSNILIEIKENYFKKVNVFIPNQSSHSNFSKDYEQTQNIQTVYDDVIAKFNLQD